MLPKQLQPVGNMPIRTGAQVKDPTANQAIGNITAATKQDYADWRNDRHTPIITSKDFTDAVAREAYRGDCE